MKSSNLPEIYNIMDSYLVYLCQVSALRACTFFGLPASAGGINCSP
jgi:hypothetical protein